LFAIARGGRLRAVGGLRLYSFEKERRAHDCIIVAKIEYLIRVANGEHVGGDPGSPSANGKAADRETGGFTAAPPVPMLTDVAPTL